MTTESTATPRAAVPDLGADESGPRRRRRELRHANVCTVDGVCVPSTGCNGQPPGKRWHRDACLRGPCDPAESCTGTDARARGYGRPENAPLGDTLRLAKSPTDTTISWTEVDGPFNVYRGFRDPGPWSYNHTCFDFGVAASPSTDTAVPISGRTFYYLVSRVAAPCSESSLGFGTPGERPDSSCP